MLKGNKKLLLNSVSSSKVEWNREEPLNFHLPFVKDGQKKQSRYMFDQPKEFVGFFWNVS